MEAGDSVNIDIFSRKIDFPASNRKRNGKSIKYCASACMALKTKKIVDALVEY